MAAWGEWGEAVWTSRDLVDEYLLTDPYGAIHGRFANEHDALVRREYLNAEGVECWVVPVAALEVEAEACPLPACSRLNDDGTCPLGYGRTCEGGTPC